MAEYRNKPGQGVMFRQRLDKSANQPDFVGTFCDEDGKEYELAGWHATGKKSLKPYVRLRVKARESVKQVAK